jgi:hypothetical protein
VNPLKTIAAVRELNAASRDLAAVPMTEPGEPESDEFLAANLKVNCAELNPHLPRRYLDPRDR